MMLSPFEAKTAASSSDEFVFKFNPSEAALNKKVSVQDQLSNLFELDKEINKVVTKQF